MKTMKYFAVIVLVMAMAFTPAITFAETARLGASGSSYNFNPTKLVVKTSDYTVTTSDSQVNVTCSSANITITLPSVSSCLSGGSRCSFKILKTDSTAYKVVVTPGTGDTIGGESTRYLINQNAYTVIHAGPGSDWSIDFESPYSVEDYEAGTLNIGTISHNASVVFEGATADDYETTLAVVDPTADGTASIPALGAATTQYFMFTSLATNIADAANSVTGKSNGLLFEGATANDYEATVTVTDPTADRTITIPDAGGTVMLSSLATNGADAANAVTGASNGLLFEGATANDYETTLTVTDPTADRTVTLPNSGGTVMLSSLSTNAADAANAVTGASNGLLYEGATADDYETTVTVTDPTADRTITIPDQSGTVVLVSGLASGPTVSALTATTALANSDCGKVLLLNSATEFVTTLPAITGTSGCTFRIIVKAAPAAASYTVVTAASANIIEGQVASAEDAAGSVSTTADSDTITFADGLAIKGDYVDLISDGTNWYISGMCNVQDGIATSQAS